MLSSLGQVRARSAGVLSLYPEMAEKHGGIPPLDYFSIVFIGVNGSQHSKMLLHVAVSSH